MVLRSKFVTSSLLFSLDQVLVALGNWIYWLIMFKLTSVVEVGQATTVYSIVLFISILTQLGLEYPLLKQSSIQGSRIFGTTLIIETVLSVVSIPVVMLLMNNLLHESLQELTWVAALMIIGTSLNFVSRFSLLGFSDAKSVLIIDISGIVIKIIVGCSLVLMGYGAFGIVFSFVLQYLFMTTFAFVVIIRRRRIFESKFANIRYFKEVIRDGLVNAPSKFSRLFIVSLSVVLLASFGITSSEIGIFYVALMITIVAASLSSSFSFMVIPASSEAKKDLSSDSFRIGLSLIVPFIVILLVAPKFLLSILGPQYIPAEKILLILSVGVFPSSIVLNAVSKLNNLNKPKKIVSIGSIQISTFLVAFVFLVPLYGTLGAAISILVSFAAASIPSLIWSGHLILRYTANSCIAIIAGTVVGYVISSIDIGYLPAAIFASFGTALTIILMLKNITTKEIIRLVHGLNRIR
jgi:O-antigen/teichoic acid export membrane protein